MIEAGLGLGTLRRHRPPGVGGKVQGLQLVENASGASVSTAQYKFIHRVYIGCCVVTAGRRLLSQRLWLAPRVGLGVEDVRVTEPDPAAHGKHTGRSRLRAAGEIVAGVGVSQRR
jgi:hypothetical protein